MTARPTFDVQRLPLPSLPRVLVREETMVGQAPAPPPEYREEHPLQTKAKDRRALRLARSAVAAAAGMVEHAETYLGDVTLRMDYAHDLMLGLEQARQALHVALSALLSDPEDAP